MRTVDLSAKMQDQHTKLALHEISTSVAKCKKIVVVTGAGISCSCGIPDFRSSDGLYNLVKQKYPDVVLKGRDLFDASLFRDPTSTSVFYTFISQLKESIDNATPAPTHSFLRTLNLKGKLLRSYTQNIDGLEARAGLLGSASQEARANGKGKAKINTKEVRNVQLHGDIHRVRCILCSAEFPSQEEYQQLFSTGIPPDCPECLERSDARVARSARALKIGTLRPAIVLYDEPHPLGDDIGTIQTADLSRKPDLLIIMGTSLRVHGLKKLVREFATSVHNNPKVKPWAGKVVFVNRTPPATEWHDVIDYHVQGDCDRWVERVTGEWRQMRPTDFEIQQNLVATNGDISISTPLKTQKKVHTVGAKRKGIKKIVPTKENSNSSRLILCSPGTSVLSKKKKPFSIVIPPNKRRRQASHYSIEASPSKKRASKVSRAFLPTEERGLLFGDATNVAPPPSKGSTPCREGSVASELTPRKPPAKRARVAYKRTIARTRSQTAATFGDGMDIAITPSRPLMV